MLHSGSWHATVAKPAHLVDAMVSLATIASGRLNLACSVLGLVDDVSRVTTPSMWLS